MRAPNLLTRFHSIIYCNTFTTGRFDNAGTGHLFCPRDNQPPSLKLGKTINPPSPPVELAGLVSEGGEIMQLHIEGSLTIPTAGIKRV